MPLDRLVGIGLVTGLALYLYFAYRQEMTDAPSEHTAAYDKLEAHDEVLPGAIEATPHSGSVWPPSTTMVWPVM